MGNVTPKQKKIKEKKRGGGKTRKYKPIHMGIFVFPIP